MEAAPELKGTTLTVAVGDSILLELPDLSGTPYEWRTGTSLDGEALVAVGGGALFPDLQSRPAGGTSRGTSVLRIAALARTAPDPIPLEFLFTRP